MNTFVFDTTALNHFAKAGRLPELKAIVADGRSVAPVQVFTELAKAVIEYPALGVVSGQDWLESVELEEKLEEVIAFAEYKEDLGGGPEKNNGEAAALAWVSVNGGIAIIDEQAATGIGQRDGLVVCGSLWLIIRGYTNGILDRATAESIVDDLINTGMWLPVENGAGLFAWAYEEGFLP